MAFDGITVAGLCSELQDTIGGGRIYKIAQTDKNELVITIRPPAERGGGQLRLYLCADPSLPLVYLTRTSRQAPLQAPAFCMLLRKHLQNGRIVSVTQPGLERILRFEVEHRNEMGDLCTHYLIVEIMGKHSNIIFLDDKDMIVDSIRHVSSLVSSVREVLPGRPYFIPDTQSKKDPLTETRQGFLSVLDNGNMDVAKLLLRSYTGFSTVAAQELAHRADLTQDRSAALLSPEEKESLLDQFEKLILAKLNGGKGLTKQEFEDKYYFMNEGGWGSMPQNYNVRDYQISVTSSRPFWSAMCTNMICSAARSRIPKSAINTRSTENC